MNSIQNSDSKQCSKSKLGQVHSVHTLDSGCARTAPRLRALHHVAGLPRPYCGLPLGRVAARTDCVVARTGRVASRLRELLRVVSQASSAVSCARSAVSWPCPTVSRPPPGASRPACLLSLLCACSACCIVT